MPAGAIEFNDHGVAIGACRLQPLSAFHATGTANCVVSYRAPGAHVVTARYAGDDNFTGSASGPRSVAAWSAQALRSQLVPSKSGTTIGTLLRRRKLVQSISAGAAGTLTIRWYVRTVQWHRHRRTLLATGHAAYTSAGIKTVTVSLTRAGRLLLRTARRFRVTDTATFSARGTSPTTITVTFVLRRR